MQLQNILFKYKFIINTKKLEFINNNKNIYFLNSSNIDINIIYIIKYIYN